MDNGEALISNLENVIPDSDYKESELLSMYYLFDGQVEKMSIRNLFKLN